MERQWADLNREVISCRRCPRLVSWREQVALEKRRAYLDWDYWGKPVPGFGDREARLLIVGLAPAAHGANRVGRMFSGDSSGRTLIPAMYRAGFANQPNSDHREDGLRLNDAYLTAIARCAPPKNRPTSEEQANCLPYLVRELALMPSIRVVLALGKIAFDGVRRLLRKDGVDTSGMAFSHGACYTSRSSLPALVASYHPSRQNTNTGRLTNAMLDEIFEQVRTLLKQNRNLSP
jgi:uracil-DNA glycosylase family 4